MRSLRNTGDVPAGEPLLADDVLELHAARLLLLVRCCGTKGRSDGTYRIDGLTKMAKLDFFVRYPQFFADVCKKLGKPVDQPSDTIESAMVRFHYGPWDRRYYHILAYLEGRKLLAAMASGSGGFSLGLTQTGTKIADQLLSNEAFADLKDQMARVRAVLGGKTGSYLKNLIYETFDDEVAKRQLGEVID